MVGPVRLRGILERGFLQTRLALRCQRVPPERGVTKAGAPASRTDSVADSLRFQVAMEETLLLNSPLGHTQMAKI